MSYLNLEGDVSSCKIRLFMSDLSLNIKWPWQSPFLSHTLKILKISTTFEDVEMILVSFFKYLYWFQIFKNSQKLGTPVCRFSMPYLKKDIQLSVPM